MLEQMKSVFCESCHSPLSSPTHPCCASDREKLLKNTHTRLFPLIFYLCEWKPPRCLLMELSDKGKSVNWPNMFAWCNIYAALLGAKAFMYFFHRFSRGGGDVGLAEKNKTKKQETKKSSGVWQSRTRGICWKQQCRIRLLCWMKACQDVTQEMWKSVHMSVTFISKPLSLFFFLFLMGCACQWTCLCFSTLRSTRRSCRVDSSYLRTCRFSHAVILKFTCSCTGNWAKTNKQTNKKKKKKSPLLLMNSERLSGVEWSW